MKKRNVFRNVRYMIIMIVLMFIVSYSSYSIVAKGNDGVYISGIDWYSDAYEVGYWRNAPKVFYSSLSSSFSVMAELNTAVRNWSSAGVTSSVTTTPTNANIRYYAGTRAQLNAIGFMYHSNIVGQTEPIYTEVGCVDTLTHSLVEYSSALASTSSDADIYAGRTTVHEYGHALGWLGHAINTDDVMYYDCFVSTEMDLSDEEGEFLSSVYEKVEEYYSSN